MKRTLAIVAGLAMLATGALAQTNVVLSRNAVGYVRVATVRSNLYLLGNQFHSLLGQPLTITNVIGSQLPSGSSALLWDPSAQAYVFENRLAGVWSPGTNRVNPGRGFWVRVSPSAPTNSYIVYMMGEVPDSNSLPSNTYTIVPGYNLISFAYPVQIPFTNTAIAANGRNGDSAIFWNPATQSYIYENRIAGSWVPGNAILVPGIGFWYKSTRTSNLTVNVLKPYTWP